MKSIISCLLLSLLQNVAMATEVSDLAVGRWYLGNSVTETCGPIDENQDGIHSAETYFEIEKNGSLAVFTATYVSSNCTGTPKTKSLEVQASVTESPASESGAAKFSLNMVSFPELGLDKELLSEYVEGYQSASYTGSIINGTQLSLELVVVMSTVGGKSSIVTDYNSALFQNITLFRKASN